MMNYNLQTIAAMFSESKITEIYCMPMIFCKELALQQAQSHERYRD